MAPRPAPSPRRTRADDHRGRHRPAQAPKHRFLNPVVLGELLKAEFERRRRDPEDCANQRQQLTDRLAKLDGELQRLTDVIASGSAPEAILLANLRETLEAAR